MSMKLKAVVLSFVVVCLGFQAFAEDKIERQTVFVQATENGFEPHEIKVKAGTHVILQVTRKTDETCATEIVFKDKKIKKDLPKNKMVTVDLGKLSKGDLGFACGMGMFSGHVIAE